MEPEDRLIWVLSLGDESVMAFTEDGVDSLVELIKIHREMPPRPVRCLGRERCSCGLRRRITRECYLRIVFSNRSRAEASSDVGAFGRLRSLRARLALTGAQSLSLSSPL